ncbi:DUF202 domain-containing protein [Rhodococcus sp. WS4]|nr:DUF202 domain-containing protein [Rhodococcus sp. WS4]
MSTQTSGDKGLQPERTSLAWRRTALSATAVTALLAHEAAARDWGLAVLPIAFAACATFVVGVISLAQARRIHKGRVGASPLGLAVMSVAVSCCALWVGAAIAYS